ncbi:hypothetical protein JIN85_16675 [Luteolibacter pohnpeiensis]|uniref:Uncharacterized protein n=1 Tax=Luteolibacter pohnpeiensis TaxID=454153 RepID=A0A934SAS4_9BACT|nr:hypothetical protein [Luteolibacter pohnpeiensis]MBK1884056.1 hypothetical protein [Luteolibacter pohnpeiensis]
MDLDAYIAETFEILATDSPEVLVEAARFQREQAGPGEHQFFNDLNEALEAEPIPV